MKTFAAVAYLFVYGTLMSTEAAHGHVASSVRSVEPAWTRGRLLHLPAGYPALVDGPEEHVFGELLEIDARVLPQLDLYEDYDPRDPENSLYRRVERIVVSEQGAQRAWCYVMPARTEPRLRAEGARWVESGRWSANVFAARP